MAVRRSGQGEGQTAAELTLIGAGNQVCGLRGRSMTEAFTQCKESLLGAKIAVEWERALRTVRLLAMMSWSSIEPGKPIAKIPCKNELDGAIGESHAQIVAISLGDDGITLDGIVVRNIVFIYVELGEINFEPHLADRFNVVGQAPAEGHRLRGLYMALDADGIQRNVALLEVAQQLQDETATLGVLSTFELDPIVVVGEPGMRISSASRAKSQLDVIRPDLLVPEGFPQSARLAVGRKNRFIDHIPRVKPARVMLAHSRDVIDKELPRFRPVFGCLNPGGHGLMPAEIVAAHEHVIGLCEAEKKIRAGKIVLIGRGTESDPLQLIGRHNDATLLAYKVGEVAIALHVMNNDRGAEGKAMAPRVSLKGTRSGYIVERIGYNMLAGPRMRTTLKQRQGRNAGRAGGHSL